MKLQRKFPKNLQTSQEIKEIPEKSSNFKRNLRNFRKVFKLRKKLKKFPKNLQTSQEIKEIPEKSSNFPESLRNS
jgi:hypothetical protein